MKSLYGCGELTLDQCHRSGSQPGAQLYRTPYQQQSFRLSDRAAGSAEISNLVAAYDAQAAEIPSVSSRPSRSVERPTTSRPERVPTCTAVPSSSSASSPSTSTRSPRPRSWPSMPPGRTGRRRRLTPLASGSYTSISPAPG
ncbi:hypothetical protein LV779_19165 [Streptomyces thinghirensis]|nr:hypothetical protein [Streptomyces thinghirensis]